MWFILLMLVLLIAVSTPTYYGTRRGYYATSTGWSVIGAFIFLFLLMVIFAGPYSGYY